MGQNWGSWTSWTPEITGSTTSPSFGTGATAVGGIRQDGTLVHWWMQLTWGSSPSAGSGYYQVPLPVTPIARDVALGHGAAVDASASFKAYPLIAVISTGLAGGLGTSPTAPFMWSTEAAGAVTDITCGASVPFAWAAGDLLNLAGCYEAATG